MLGALSTQGSGKFHLSDDFLSRSKACHVRLPQALLITACLPTNITGALLISLDHACGWDLGPHQGLTFKKY